MDRGLEIFLKLYNDDHDFFASVCERMSADSIWMEPKEGVSIANILCHIAEMEKFWIDQGLFDETYDRDRQTEFSRRKDLAPEKILERLTKRRELTLNKLKEITEDNLHKTREFHGDTMVGWDILMWHVHHLGLHRGHIQILERHILGKGI